MNVKGLKSLLSWFAGFVLAPSLPVAFLLVCLWNVQAVLQEKHVSRLITDPGYRVQATAQLEQFAAAAACQQMAGDGGRYETLRQAHHSLVSDYNSAMRRINAPLERELDSNPKILVHGYMITIWRDQCLGQRLLYLGA